jgi:predicted O-methyltransferase YrrM
MEKFNNFKIVEGDSKVILNPEFFQKFFPEGLDYVFVDGGHSYLDAFSDLNNVFPFVKQNGLIVVDDYNSRGPEGCSIPDVDNAVDFFCNAHSQLLSKTSWTGVTGKGCALIRKL